MSPQEQAVERTQRRKKVAEPKLEFSPEKVFGGPEKAKDEDFVLDLETSRYVAQHGQGGDRRA